MTRTLLFTTFLPFLAGAQISPAKLEFEVASIRPSATTDGRTVNIGMHIDGAQVRFNFLSLQDCVRTAWQVKDFQVVGPEWTASDRFDISAKLPAGAGQDQVREMLQNLLLDRFKMTYHKETREFPVYALVVGKNGLKMKEAAPVAGADAPGAVKPAMNINATGSAAGVFVDLGQGAYYSFVQGRMEGHNMPVPRIADTLASYMDKPVLDMTGLTAGYDFVFTVTEEDERTMMIRAALRHGVTLPPQAARLAEGSTDSLYSALEALGLKMESRKAPQDVIVIDKAEKTPTEN